MAGAARVELRLGWPPYGYEPELLLAGTSLSVYPNPTADGALTVELLGYRQPVTLTLLNALGQSVRTRVVAATAAAPQLELHGLAPGVYVLRAVTLGGTDTRRVVVSR